MFFRSKLIQYHSGLSVPLIKKAKCCIPMKNDSSPGLYEKSFEYMKMLDLYDIVKE